METYDIIMLVVLIGAMLYGAIKGFAWQLASIASIVVSYVVAYKFREPFSQSIQADPPWNRFLAMLILFVGTSLVVWVAFRMVSGTIDRMKLREFDRQIGALFGLAKGGLYCVLITLFAVTLLGDRVGSTIIASKSGRYIAMVLDRSQAVIPPEIHEIVEPYLERFDQKFNQTGQQVQPGSNGTFNQIHWLTEGETTLRNAAQNAVSNAVQNWPNQPSSTEPPAQPNRLNQFINPAQPIAPTRTQNPSPIWPPQQAQQQQPPPAWNGFQR